MTAQNNQNQPIKVKCIGKHRDKTGKILGYTLQDSTGKKANFYSTDLKEHIKNKRLIVTNLTLTSDNRLVEKSEKKDNISVNNKQVTNKKIEKQVKPIKQVVEERPLRHLNLEELSEKLESYIKFECSDLGGSKFDELYANNNKCFETINMIREELITRKCLTENQFELWMTGSDNENRGYHSYYHNKYTFMQWLDLHTNNTEQSRKVRFMVEIDKILRGFTKRVGSGDIHVEPSESNEEYLQGTIYGMYYNYYGDMYGLTFGIDTRNSEAYTIFQRNCMADPVFELSEKLTTPIETKESLIKIKQLYDKTYKQFNNWRTVDEKLNAIRDELEPYVKTLLANTKFEDTTLDDLDASGDDGCITAYLKDFDNVVELVINMNNETIEFKVDNENKTNIKCLDKTVETLNLAYTIILTSEIKQVNMKEVIIYKGKVQK